MADTFLRKIRNSLEDIKAILAILVFFGGGLGYSVADNMDKTKKLESATYALKTTSEVIAANRDKIIAPKQIIKETTVIHSGCPQCRKIESEFKDHLRRFH